MHLNAMVGCESGSASATYPSSHQILFDNVVVRDICICDRCQMLGHSFWEGFAYLVMRSYCQKWHLDIADFRGGMSTAHVPFARCICWEQELTNQNLKEVTRFSCYLILTRQHLGS